MITAERFLAAVGAALEYPGPGWRAAVVDLEQQLVGHRAQSNITAFLQAIAGHSDAAVAEVYTRTFDLAPQCAPYLSIHVFGEQDARRTGLMIGLAAEYGSVGFDRGAELPDHVAVVLKALHEIAPSVRQDLIRLCVRPALLSMIKQLHAITSPYEHLLLLAVGLIDDSAIAAEVRSEVAHA